MNTAFRPHAVIAAARSFLFVPGTWMDRVAKALASGADAVIIDLEDAVAPADKATARDALADVFACFSPAEYARVAVRVNAQGTSWYAEDLALMGRLRPSAIVLPKAETASALNELAQAAGAGCGLVALVESVAGLDAAHDVAAASQVVRLAFGNLDFQADAGMAPGPDEAELAPVRLALVLASRRAGLAPPVDGVTASTQDTEQLKADARRARRMGFGAKLCIHPAQVAPVNDAFMPAPEQVAWAWRVVEASEAAGGGVTTLDGRMVDAPVLRSARHILAMSDRG